MARRSTLLATAALLVCLAAAGAAAPGIPSAVPASKLAFMPLPLAAYGSDAAALPLDADESGVKDNAEAASGSTDRKDSAASLKAAGRISGYGVQFANYDLFAKPGKLVFVSSGVDLYGTAKQASAGLEREFRDILAADPANGLAVLSSSRFATPGVGGDAHGLRVALRLGSARGWYTGVIFRRREVIVSIGLLRTDATSENALALRLARAASARVADVLAGKITTPPAKLPVKKPDRVVTPAAKIDTGALTSADLKGAKVTRQGYVRDDDAIATYERAFDRVTYGSSRLLSAETDVSLYASKAEASVYLDGIRGVFDPSNSAFRGFIMNAFAQGAGFKLKSFSVIRHRAFALPGARGTELILRLATPFGRSDGAYVFMSSGRFVGTLIATSAFGATVEPADLARLEGAFAKRLQAAANDVAHAA